MQPLENRQGKAMKEWLRASEVRNLENCSIRTIRKRIDAGKYTETRKVKSDKGGRGGIEWEVHISALSDATQTAYVHSIPAESIRMDLLTHLHPLAHAEAVRKINGEPDPAAASLSSLYNKVGNTPLPGPSSRVGRVDCAQGPDLKNMEDERVGRLAAMVHEAECPPHGTRKKDWVAHVAVKYEVNPATVWRNIKKYKEYGLAGLRHGNARTVLKKKRFSWTPDAVDYWRGLWLKRAHRKMSGSELYRHLKDEARRRGWKIAGYPAAMKLLREENSKALVAYSRGGIRALDNALAPILRRYNDLPPFYIIVGDQHKFDLWVMDDETGELFRPEGYLWQDLRTRIWYGAAIGRRYDSKMIGLSLRMGCRLWGRPAAIYTDNGKPELSDYITSVIQTITRMGITVKSETAGDAPDIEEMSNEDAECINPVASEQIHRKAIVRNAKAKMIESSFHFLEDILRNRFRVPGSVKTLGGDETENEVDQAEIDRLARERKLLTFREFGKILFQALDYYNQERHHRGVHAEWDWRPKPAHTAPMDVLKQCCAAGWRPTWADPHELDSAFLSRANRGGRVVQRGRIFFKNGPCHVYESDDLLPHDGRRLEVRYDAMDPSWIMCFTAGGRYVCTATPVIYGSMVDPELTERLIHHKRGATQAVIEQYKDLTMTAPELLADGDLLPSERPEAIHGPGKQALLEARKEPEPENPMDVAQELADRESEAEAEARRKAEADAQAQAELDAEIARREAEMAADAATPKRPVFQNSVDRYEWCVGVLSEGGRLDGEDVEWMGRYEAEMSAEDAAFIKMRREAMEGK